MEPASQSTTTTTTTTTSGNSPGHGLVFKPTAAPKVRVNPDFMPSPPSVPLGNSPGPRINIVRNFIVEDTPRDPTVQDDIESPYDSLSGFYVDAPIKTPPVAQSNKTESSTIKTAILGAVKAVAEKSENPEIKAAGTAAKLYQLAQDAKALFLSWWEECVKFFHATGKKIKRGFKTFARFFSKLFRALVEYVSASATAAKEWFLGISLVSGEKPEVPICVEQGSAPANFEFRVNGSTVADILHEFSSPTPVAKAHEWVHHFASTMKGDITSAQFVAFVIMLGVVTCNHETFVILPIHYKFLFKSGMSDPCLKWNETCFTPEFDPLRFDDKCVRLEYVVDREQEPLKFQSGWMTMLDVAPLFSFLTSLACSILGAIKASTDFLNNLDVGSFGVAFTAFLGAYANFKRSNLGENIEWFIDKIVHFISGVSLSERFSVDRQWKECVERLNKNLVLVSSVRNASPVVSTAISNDIATLESLYHQMIHFFPRSTAGTRAVYEDLRRRGSQFDAGVVPQERHKPVSFLFCGKAGTGKTTLQRLIVAHVLNTAVNMIEQKHWSEEDIASIRALARDPSCFSYNAAETKAAFDDGYRNQAFTAFEELGSISSADTSLEWTCKYFRHIDSQPLLLNMAFADKGKRYFNSPFVIATSNAPDIPAIVNFADAVAVRRRIEFHLLVTHPDEAPFHIDNIRCQFHPEAVKILSDSRLSPSPLLTARLPYLSKGFDVATLINLAAGVYIERLHARDRTSSYTVPIDPSICDELFDIIDPSSRQGRLSPAAINTVLPTTFPVFRHDVFEASITYQSFCRLTDMLGESRQEGAEIQGGSRQQIQAAADFLLDAGLVPTNLTERVKDAFNVYASVEIRAAHHKYAYRCAGTHGELVVLLIIAGDKPDEAEERLVVKKKASSDKGKDKERDEEILSFQSFVTTESWHVDPDAPCTFKERFEIFKAFLTPTIELFPFDPRVMRECIVDFKSHARRIVHEIQGAEGFDNYDNVLRRVGRISARDKNGSLNLAHVYTLYANLTRNYAASRLFAARVTFDSPKKDVQKVIAAGIFVVKHIHAIDELLTDRKRELATVDEDYLSHLPRGRVNLTVEQLRSFNYHLKKIGKQGNARGAVFPLTGERLRAYERRVLANRRRNETKNESLRNKKQEEEQAYANQKSRVDIDRRVAKKRTVQRKRARENMSWQGLTKMVSSVEQVLMAERPVVAHGRFLSEIPTQGFSSVRQWFSSNTVNQLLGNVKPKGLPVYDAICAFSMYARSGLPQIDQELWMWRTFLFSVFCHKLIHRFKTRILPVNKKFPADVHTYARLQLPTMATHCTIADWQTVACLALTVATDVPLAESAAYVDYYVNGTGCDSFTEIDDQDVMDAIKEVLESIPYDGNCAKYEGPKLPNHGKVEEVDLASFRPLSADDTLIAASVTVIGLGAIASLAAAMYAVYRGYQSLQAHKLNYETFSKPAITESELVEFETKLAALGFTATYQRRPGTDKILMDPEYLPDQSADPDPNKALNVKIKATTRPATDLKFQGGANDESVIRSIVGNMYKVYVPSGSNWLPIADILFVFGRIAILPRHVYNAMKRFDSLRFEPAEESRHRTPFEVHNLNLIQPLYCRGPEICEERCVVHFNIPRLPMHQKILTDFATDDMLHKRMGDFGFSGLVVGLDVAPGAEKLPDRHIGTFHEGVLMSRGHETNIDGSRMQMYSESDSYIYAGSKPGSCGRVLIQYADGRSYIRSTHVAGSVSSNQGRAVIWTREFLTAIFDKYKDHPTMETALMSQCAVDPVVPGAYEITENVIATRVHTSALDHTNFVPTVFTTEEYAGGSPVRPCIMDDNGYVIARDKELKRVQCIDAHPDAYAIVSNFVLQIIAVFLFYTPVDLSGCRRLSCYEALTYCKGLNPFSPVSSRGIRLKLRGWKKEAVLGYDGTPPDPDIRGSFEADIAEYFNLGDTQLVYPYQINFDKLKDEPLENKFVDAGKVRLFNITDFYDNTLMKMSIGDLVRKLDFLHMVGPQTCGLNMRGEAARQIYDMFAGRTVLAFDVSGFDNTVNAIFLPAAQCLIRKAYSRLADRRWAMWALMSTLHSLRFDRKVGRYRGLGNTSGNWLTTWINTLCNTVYFSTAVVYLALKHGDDPAQALSELRLRVYSDDNLSSLNRAWYTPTNVRDAFWHLFKVELTNADKSPVTEASVYTIDNAEFLSRTFRNDGGIVFCPLAIPSLMGQLYYVRCPRNLFSKRKYILKQLATNLGNVANELYEYPEEIAHHIAASIFSFLERVRLPCSMFPYDFDLDRRLLKLSN